MAIDDWKRTVAKREKVLTEREIEELRQSAGRAGDLAQVHICDRTLGGSRKASLECASVIAEHQPSLVPGTRRG